jgi:septum formation protein
MPEIILASQSPRRRDLLTKMGLEFTIIPSDIPEPLDEANDPRDNAKHLALAKAMHIAKSHPNAYVIGSDTIVAVGARQLGKAETLDEAREMLMLLSSQPSIVATSIALIHLASGLSWVDVDVVDVYFKPDNPEMAKKREDYLALNTWQDKAGAYGIQTGAAPLIERISGNITTVLGLPTNMLADMLLRVGIQTLAVEETSPVPSD